MILQGVHLAAADHEALDVEIAGTQRDRRDVEHRLLRPLIAARLSRPTVHEDRNDQTEENHRDEQPSPKTNHHASPYPTIGRSIRPFPLAPASDSHLPAPFHLTNSIASREDAQYWAFSVFRTGRIT
jgi:hypothetical protein